MLTVHNDRRARPERNVRRSMVQSWRVAVVHLALWWMLVGTSVTLLGSGYMLFYRWYIPAERIVSPIYLQYGEEAGPTVSLRINGARPGIPYDVSLQMLVPDFAGLSESLGNIMVRTVLASGELKANSSRPTLLHYRSWPVRITQLPPVILGLAREATTHRLFLLEEVTLPDAAVNLTLSFSQNVPIHEATLELVAHFCGLRYYMYYWRWAFAAAVVGVASLLAIIAITIGLAISLYLRIRGSEAGFGSETAVAERGSEIATTFGSESDFRSGTTTGFGSESKSRGESEQSQEEPSSTPNGDSSGSIVPLKKGSHHYPYQNLAAAVPAGVRRRTKTTEVRVPNGTVHSGSEPDTEDE